MPQKINVKTSIIRQKRNDVPTVPISPGRAYPLAKLFFSCLPLHFLPLLGMTTRRACLSVAVVVFAVVFECFIRLRDELQGGRVGAEAAVAAKMAGGRRRVLPPDQNGETPDPAGHPPAARHCPVCPSPHVFLPSCSRPRLVQCLDACLTFVLRRLE